MQQSLEDPLFVKSVVTRELKISYIYCGETLPAVLEKILITRFAGKCSHEGYINSQGIKLISYTAGELTPDAMVIYTVVFECLIFNPASDTILTGKVRSVTKAGLEIISDIHDPSPFNAFIISEHAIAASLANYKISDRIEFKVIGSVNTLGDKQMHIIGNLVTK